jgi:hypothetical protein
MPISRWLQHPRWRRWLPWLCGLVAAAIAAKSLIGGYGDLGIYLDTARELREGGFDLFRPREGSGPWTYPHVALLPFVALQWVLDDAAIRWLWCAGLGAATALLLGDLARAMAYAGGLRWWQWLAFGVLFQRCIAQNLTHGQLSLWVGVLLLRGVVLLQAGRDREGGAWLGLAAALKLTPFLFALALPVMGRTRAATAMLTAAAIAVFALPWPFCGTADHARHLGDCWRAMVAPSLGGTDGGAALQYGAGPSVTGTLDYLLQARPVDRDGRTVNVLDLGDGALRAAKLAWSALLGVLLLLLFVRARRREEAVRLPLQASAVMLAMALFSPLTRVYHLAGAVLPFAWFCRGPRARGDLLWWLTAAAFLFAMTLRQKKLLGETLWRAFDHGGLLHFATLGLLCWLVRDARGATAQTAAP